MYKLGIAVLVGALTAAGCTTAAGRTRAVAGGGGHERYDGWWGARRRAGTDAEADGEARCDDPRRADPR